MKKILFIIGTRPEIIKTAPVIIELKKDKSYKVTVCFTGQHKDMAMRIIEEFSIKIDYDLKLMKPGQSLAYIAQASISKIFGVISDFKPDLIIIQGDTTTAFCAGLSAFYMKIRVAHIEAGLRTYDKYRPYPEEANRAMISKIADLHFAPTSESAKNLIKEGVPRNSIIITGNTAIDALLYIKNNKKDFDAGLLRNLPKDKRIILVTAHRRENFGKPIKDICEALRILAKSCGDIIIIYPVHRNPNILRPVMSHIGGIKNIMLLDPLGYGDFVKLMDRACLILTDSGGIQEEAPSLGKPVLILRDKTERPEVVRAGCAKIVGTDTKKIVRHSRALLKSKRCYNGMSIKKNPVGDGKAALRIKKALDNLYRC